MAVLIATVKHNPVQLLYQVREAETEIGRETVLGGIKYDTA